MSPMYTNYPQNVPRVQRFHLEPPSTLRSKQPDGNAHVAYESSITSILPMSSSPHHSGLSNSPELFPLVLGTRRQKILVDVVIGPSVQSKLSFNHSTICNSA